MKSPEEIAEELWCMVRDCGRRGVNDSVFYPVWNKIHAVFDFVDVGYHDHPSLNARRLVRDSIWDMSPWNKSPWRSW